MTALFSLYEVAGFSMPETRGVLPWPWVLTLNLNGAGVTVSSSPDCTYKGVISSNSPQTHLEERLLRTLCASYRCCTHSTASAPYLASIDITEIYCKYWLPKPGDEDPEKHCLQHFVLIAVKNQPWRTWTALLRSARGVLSCI